MARCYLTGVEITLDDAFVLNLTTAHRTLRELKEKVATLERLIAQLGGTDLVPIPNRGGAGTFLRKDRRVVSRPMALALAAICPDRCLFLPWTIWRARGRTLPLSALHHHPDYGPRLRELSVVEAEQVVTLARQVLHRLAPGEHLAHEVRTAVIAGVCVTLRERSPEEVIAILRHRLTADEPLEDLGVPAQVEAEFRAVLRPGSTEAWGAPRVEPDREAVGLADIEPRQESE
jgi:hypothetical protein